MAEYVGWLIGLVLSLLVATFGWQLGRVQGAETALAHVAEAGVQAMQVAGGYTSQVQQLVVQDLQQAGFNPADVDVLPNPSGQRVAYGNALGLTLNTRLPILIVGYVPTSLGIQETAMGISQYVPQSAASQQAVTGSSYTQAAGGTGGAQLTWASGSGTVSAALPPNYVPALTTAGGLEPGWSDAGSVGLYTGGPLDHGWMDPNQIGSGVSYTLTLSQPETVAYGLPAGAYANDAPLGIWVNGQQVATISGPLEACGQQVGQPENLWQTTLQPGTYTVRISPTGPSPSSNCGGAAPINVYGLWTEPAQ